jgi:hypothetical protein
MLPWWSAVAIVRRVPTGRAWPRASRRLGKSSRFGGPGRAAPGIAAQAGRGRSNRLQPGVRRRLQRAGIRFAGLPEAARRLEIDPRCRRTLGRLVDACPDLVFHVKHRSRDDGIGDRPARSAEPAARVSPSLPGAASEAPRSRRLEGRAERCGDASRTPPGDHARPPASPPVARFSSCRAGSRHPNPSMCRSDRQTFRPGHAVLRAVPRETAPIIRLPLGSSAWSAPWISLNSST